MNENQFGVLLEDILDRVKAIAEGQRVMESKLHNMENKLHNIESDVKQVKSDVKVIKSYLGAVEDGLNDHERRLLILEKRVSGC
ncbi:MAG: hypothetical protein AB1420_03515 [Bacillota bacterium]